MENEQMNPTYEQLAQAYNQLANENQQMRIEFNSVRNDKLLEKLKILMQIIEYKDCYSDKIVSLANWHIEQILAKPKKQ